MRVFGIGIMEVRVLHRGWPNMAQSCYGLRYVWCFRQACRIALEWCQLLNRCWERCIVGCQWKAARVTATTRACEAPIQHTHTHTLWWATLAAHVAACVCVCANVHACAMHIMLIMTQSMLVPVCWILINVVSTLNSIVGRVCGNFKFMISKAQLCDLNFYFFLLLAQFHALLEGITLTTWSACESKN